MRENKGQVAIVVLILTALALSFGLSSTRQTLVDTRIETDTKDLREAFSAAESAIEQYWSTDGSLTEYTNSIGASGVVDSANIGSITVGAYKYLEYPDYVTTSTRSYFWLMAHDVDGNLDAAAPANFSGTSTIVCYDEEYVGGLQVEILYKSGTTYIIERVGYNVGRPIGDTYGTTGFMNIDPTTTPALVSCPVGSNKKGFEVDFSMLPIITGSKVVVAIVRPLTEDLASALNRGTRLLLTSNDSDFPSQGVQYTSVGTKGSASRSLRVDDRWVLPLGLELWLDTATSGDSIEGN